MPPKKKAEKMSLNDFLGNADFGSWADEMEDFPTAPAGRPGGDGGGSSALSRAPDRGDRNYPPRDEVPLPTKPPFTAFVGNLPFDVTESDLGGHFRDVEINSVKIIKDREEKPKGFGYVEFATLDGLKSGLALSQSTLAGRSIRVSVAEPPKEGGRGFGDRSTFGASTSGSFDDDRQWRRDGPLPPRDDDRRSSGFGGSGFGRGGGGGGGGGRFSEDGGERGERGGFGSKFQAREPAPGSIAEETNDWRSNMRAPAPPTPQQDKPRFGSNFGGDRERFGGGGEMKRRGSGFSTPTNAGVESPKVGPADLEDKWTIGSKFKPSQSSPERPNETGERGTFGKKFGEKFGSDAPDTSDDVHDWRSVPRKVVSGSSTPAVAASTGFGRSSMERSPSTSGPPTRRKLDLLPRSNAPGEASTPVGSPKSGEATPASATSAKPNPFGTARPVDAAAREREITEKMERAKLASTPVQNTTSLTFSRSSSRAASRQGSRAGSPTRSPSSKPSALGLGGMGPNTSTPTASQAPKILSRPAGVSPSGRTGGNFGHGRVPSVGMSPRTSSTEPGVEWRRGSAPNSNSNNHSSSTPTAGESTSTSAPTPERRPSAVRPSFSFAKAASASNAAATPPPLAPAAIASEQAEVAES